MNITHPETPKAEMLTRVVCTFDVDCDGTSFAYHRIQVPADLAYNARDARYYAGQTEQMSGYGDECEVLSEQDFLARCSCDFSDFDRDYWREEGYYSTGVCH